MKLLVIKPNPELTREELLSVKKDLLDSIRAGIIFEVPDIMSHEVVEFDSIEYDNQRLYPKLPKGNHRELREKYRELMNARVNHKKGEKPNDNSGNDVLDNQD